MVDNNSLKLQELDGKINMEDLNLVGDLEQRIKGQLNNQYVERLKSIFQKNEWDYQSIPSFNKKAASWKLSSHSSVDKGHEDTMRIHPKN